MTKIMYDWSPEKMVEVRLKEPDDFLKIKETLTRIGVESKASQTLYQTCHILHKRGKYYIVHFKELFALDGKEATLTVEDVERRNTIALLLGSWGLLSLVERLERVEGMSVKVVPFRDKPNWNLVAKYTIGEKHEV